MMARDAFEVRGNLGWNGSGLLERYVEFEYADCVSSHDG